MATYYDELGVQATATTADVEAAYDQWRRLVTHHDPAVAGEANQKLQTLEVARGVLTDPHSRATYDRELQHGTAGLADPTAVPTPSPPVVSSTPPSTGETPIGVKCMSPTCGAINDVPDARFCLTCGASLVQTCPNPGCRFEMRGVFTFCPRCGCNVAEERARVEAEILREEVGARSRAPVLLQEVHLLLEQGRWRRAKPRLACFDGLGRSALLIEQVEKIRGPVVKWLAATTNGRIGEAERPSDRHGRDLDEWQAAKFLEDNADMLRSELMQAMLKWTLKVWLPIAAVVGIVNAIGSRSPSGLMLTVGVAALALICPIVYEVLIAGDYGERTDRIGAIVSPLAGWVVVSFWVAIVITTLVLGGIYGALVMARRS